MKKKYLYVVFLLLLLSIGGYLVTSIYGTPSYKSDTEEKLKIVTSFYPMYIAALNVTKDMDHVTVVNMTGPVTGCLHDYQLTPENIITLSDADIFIVNGGGIESFLDDVLTRYPELNIVTASEGITMLSAQYGYVDSETYQEYSLETSEDMLSHEEDEDHSHEDSHGDYNAHVWMSIEKYSRQVDNIAAGIIAVDESGEENYKNNTQIYKDKLSNLKTRAGSVMDSLKDEDVIIFHDAFAYFASEFGMNIRYIIDMDENTSLSANQAAILVDMMKEEEITILFAEAQYGTSVADAIARENDAAVYILDSLVSGENHSDSYLLGMEKNLEVLKEALQ